MLCLWLLRKRGQKRAEPLKSAAEKDEFQEGKLPGMTNSNSAN